MGGSTNGNFGRTKGSFKRSKSNKDSHLYGKPGQIKRSGYKETHIGLDGRATKEIHYSDHGNPKNHTNPHEHNIRWDKNGNPIFKTK
jgi:hypothetical protein